MRFKEILFTAFYAGYCPIVPGTAGTIVGIIIYIIEYLIFKESVWIVNAFFVIILFYPSIKIGDAGEKFFNKKDPPQVVIDEMMGFWISVLFFPFNWKIIVLAFFLFRILDILKPIPINRLQKFNGGIGILLDDCMAGIYTNLILLLISIISGWIDMPVYL